MEEIVSQDFIFNEKTGAFSKFEYLTFEYYNDYNVKGNIKDCKHQYFNRVVSSNGNVVNHYCCDCNMRKLFTKYAKFIKK